MGPEGRVLKDAKSLSCKGPFLCWNRQFLHSRDASFDWYYSSSPTYWTIKTVLSAKYAYQMIRAFEMNVYHMFIAIFMRSTTRSQRLFDSLALNLLSSFLNVCWSFDIFSFQAALSLAAFSYMLYGRYLANTLSTEMIKCSDI